MSRDQAGTLLSRMSGLETTPPSSGLSERALQELEAEQLTVLEVEASTPKTVGLD